jgi:hypothetical protein
MATSQNPTIVVTWDPGEFGYLANYGTVEAKSPMRIRVKGAGFDSKESVVITICEKNTVIGKAAANPCGAFVTIAKLPSGLPVGVISVKAMGKETIRAAWPLDIVAELQLPKTK